MKEINNTSTRLIRSLEKKTNNIDFLKYYNFYYDSFKKDLLTFCGSNIKVIYNENSYNAKISFLLYETGEMSRLKPFESAEPEIFRNVLIGKKAWGLWVDQWSDGIVEGSFTKYEILKQFKEKKIIIPDSLLIDFNNKIYDKTIIRLNNVK